VIARPAAQVKHKPALGRFAHVELIAGLQGVEQGSEFAGRNQLKEKL
jgi:hypothetical protein